MQVAGSSERQVAVGSCSWQAKINGNSNGNEKLVGSKQEAGSKSQFLYALRIMHYDFHFPNLESRFTSLQKGASICPSSRAMP
jgi:hypothetical protein